MEYAVSVVYFLARGLMLLLGITLFVGFFPAIFALFAGVSLGKWRWKSTPLVLVLTILAIGYISWVWDGGPVRGLKEMLSVPFQQVHDSRLAETAPEPTVIERGTEIRRYLLVSYRPPKHFYVTIKQMDNNEVVENLYVSKHCNRAGELRSGDQFNIKIRKYSMSNQPDIIRYQFSDLYNTFC